MPVAVRSIPAVPFHISALVVLESSWVGAAVKTLKSSLLTRFGYPNWPLKRDLLVSDVIAFLEEQPGVISVHLDGLCTDPTKEPVVRDVRLDSLSIVQAAQGVGILYLDPGVQVSSVAGSSIRVVTGGFV
jgi:hypothetical protein